ncbi:segregation/condensation protein A [Candidatus Kaiserbacteria bacterium]|nr:segregation/condensation protein A [Candidatus Kaiserbacteria bacterium]
MTEETFQQTIPSFSVKTEVFEGPLELLIELIEKRKLLINDISLASVTDEYMAQVALLEQQNIQEISQFIALASTLLLIKSRSLLPVLELTKEEEESIDNLEERLKRYQVYRKAGMAVAEAFGLNIMHERSYSKSTEPLFITDSYTEKTSLAEAIWSVIQELPKKVEPPKVRVRKVISLDEMMDNLKERVERQMRLSFKEFTKSNEKPDVIVGFLAVLEMVKQGSVLVEQAERFKDIEIKGEKKSEVPRYI